MNDKRQSIKCRLRLLKPTKTVTSLEKIYQLDKTLVHMHSCCSAGHKYACATSRRTKTYLHDSREGKRQDLLSKCYLSPLSHRQKIN